MNETIMYYGTFILLMLTIVVMAFIAFLVARSMRKNKTLGGDRKIKGKSTSEQSYKKTDQLHRMKRIRFLFLKSITHWEVF